MNKLSESEGVCLGTWKLGLRVSNLFFRRHTTRHVLQRQITPYLRYDHLLEKILLVEEHEHWRLLEDWIPRDLREEG